MTSTASDLESSYGTHIDDLVAKYSVMRDEVGMNETELNVYYDHPKDADLILHRLRF